MNKDVAVTRRPKMVILIMIGGGQGVHIIDIEKKDQIRLFYVLYNITI